MGPEVASALMLSPYRVLDLTDERGQFAGLILAVLGADVVAVELPGGASARSVGPLDPDDRSLPFLAFNRGKRSIGLDLTSRSGRDSLDALAAGADVVLACSPPRRGDDHGSDQDRSDQDRSDQDGSDRDSSDQARLDLDALAERHPHLVVVSMSP